MFFFVLQLLLGWLLADFVSGILHFAQDKLGSKDTPLFGHIINAGRTHHEDPLKFLSSTLWHRNRYNVLGALAFCVLATLVFGLQPSIFAATAGGLLMIEIQILAHKPDIPLWARLLQATGIIQRPKQHQAHHVEHNRTYCVVTSWFNPWLDKSGLWRLLHNVTKRWQGRTSI